ncbi:MAG: thiamine-phosphate kinase [Thermodesulfobacteriota bacterium]
METLSDAGEFGLIRGIRRLLKKAGATGTGVVLGVGDDTAAMTPTPGHDLLVTCDCMVEDRHFLKDVMSPYEIGRRAMAANISDIGAMGGIPRWALVSLGLENDSLVPDVLEMYRGFLDQLNPLNAIIAGGNITRSKAGTFIDITLMGEVARGRMVSRSGARPGDAVLVSGFPGQAAAGLDLLLHGEDTGNSSEAMNLMEAYRNPDHRVLEGQCMAGTGLANAMIDISDGLLADLGHICEESNVGAELHEEVFPVSDALRWDALRKDMDPPRLVTRASDDYELIVTCAPSNAEELKAAVARVSLVPMTRVGWITGAAGRMDLVRRDGTRDSVEGEGWDHFSVL